MGRGREARTRVEKSGPAFGRTIRLPFQLFVDDSFSCQTVHFPTRRPGRLPPNALFLRDLFGFCVHSDGTDLSAIVAEFARRLFAGVFEPRDGSWSEVTHLDCGTNDLPASSERVIRTARGAQDTQVRRFVTIFLPQSRLAIRCDEALGIPGTDLAIRGRTK